MRLPDQRLVEQTRLGDLRAFEQLVHTYYRAVFALACALTDGSDEAEDLTQACFVDAFERLGELRDTSRFSSWLYAIARNRCRYWMRHQPRRPTLVPDPSQLRADDPPELSSNPEQHVLDSVRDQLIRGSVAALPREYRDVVVLRYVAELSYGEIADALGIKTSTVSMRLHRAKLMLRQRLQEATRECGAEVTP